MRLELLELFDELGLYGRGGGTRKRHYEHFVEVRARLELFDYARDHDGGLAAPATHHRSHRLDIGLLGLLD